MQAKRRRSVSGPRLRASSVVAAALAAALAVLGAAPVVAQQGASDRPISAIDWLNGLDSLAALPQAGTEFGLGTGSPTEGLPIAEAPTAQSALAPEVTTSTLDETRAGGVGLLPQSVTGLPGSLWQGSDAQVLSRKIEALDVDRLPSMQSLLYSLLLAEADPPTSEGDAPSLLLARIDKLLDLGAVNPALALVERAGPARHPAIFARWFDMALLAGTEAEACRQLIETPDLSPGYDAQIFCQASLGDWSGAALTFNNVRALGLLPPATEGLLLRYLDVDLDEVAVALPPPSRVTPLTFRLQEAIGEPLPAASLPRAFAMTDLRNVSGWKAEIEAAERLARTGAMPENRLLGVYSDREPAASGGIWDRVEAIQDFDDAIRAGREPDRALAALPAAWAAMRAAELEVPFARLYGAMLADIAPASGPARAIVFRAALLSDEYETAAARLLPQTPTERFMIGLARGEPLDDDVTTLRAAAIASGFDLDRPLPRNLRAAIAEDRLGEAILNAMALYARAVSGEWKDISDALAMFRRVGLEDTARRAALQMLILERSG